MPDLSVQQRFCRNCGHRIRAGAAFCVSCGKPLYTSQQSAGHVPESPSDATGSERPDIAQNRDEGTRAVLAFVFAESWEESKRAVEEHRDALLTDAADEELAALIVSNKDNEDTVGALKEHRALLARCRRGGIDAAFGEYLQPSPATQEDQVTDAERNQVLAAVAEFVNARTWVASKLILKQRQNLLLTDTADEILSAFIAQRHRDGDGDVRNLEEHRRLLARCRQKGIDAAFAERSQKKKPFLEWAGEWLIAIVILVLFIVAINLFT